MGARKDAAAAVLAVKRAEDRATALEHRRNGMSYRAIAAAMGCSLRNAADLVQEGLAELPREHAEAVRELDLQRIDQMLRGLFTPLFFSEKGSPVSGGAVEGEPRAVLAATKLLERRARLLGLDAPTKLDATVGRKSLKDMSDEELLALKAEMAAAKESA